MQTNNANLVDLGKKLLDACKNGETEEVRELVQSGAPFTTDWLGTSPLHFAAQYGHTETAEVLLRAGVSRDTRTKVERTPLHVSAQEGHLSIVNLLLTHGADIDARDLLKMTPLHWAVERGHRDVTECLLASGADVNLMSKFDKTPIDIARDAGRIDLIPILESYSNCARPRLDHKSNVASNSNSKSRPTVLPNKSNRTSRVVKSVAHSSNVTPSSSNIKLSSSTTSKTINLENIKKLFNGNTVEDNSNNVLTALAALAEVSASSGNNSATIATEALQFLDSQGISASTEDPIFQSALESGQTLSLTEGGKLALNCVKEESKQCQSETTSKNNKVITIVSDSGQVPQIITSNQSTPIVLLSSGTSLGDSSDSRAKKMKQLPKLATISNFKSHAKVGSNIDSGDLEKEKLRKELENTKREAEEYKAAFLIKEKEAEQYKKQLELYKSKFDC